MEKLMNFFLILSLTTLFPILNLVQSVDLRIIPKNKLQMVAGASSRLRFLLIYTSERLRRQTGAHSRMSGLSESCPEYSTKRNQHCVTDFVIYLGDVITANNIMISNATLYWDQATSPTRVRGIPWASVFGNHDDALFEWPMEWFSGKGIPQLCCPSPSVSHLGEQDCSFRGTHRLELMRNDIEKNNLSYSKTGPKELWPSVSNYVLQVSSPYDPHSPLAFLYFLDSGGGSYPQVISKAQADWFKHKSQELNPDSSVPEIIFWHIPSTAYKKVAPRFMSFSSCVGSINAESVSSQEAEMGIMKVIEKRPSVKAIFVGHNHGLDWCCPYNKNLWLCFARHTGYGGYGNWARGARVLEIGSQPFFLKTWIRMEDGSSHSEVKLSP